jgi:hypothetical protein
MDRTNLQYFTIHQILAFQRCRTLMTTSKSNTFFQVLTLNRVCQVQISK